MKAKTIKLFGIIMMLVMGMSFNACSSDDDDDMPKDPTENSGSSNSNNNNNDDEDEEDEWYDCNQCKDGTCVRCGGDGLWLGDYEECDKCDGTGICSLCDGEGGWY